MRSYTPPTWGAASTQVAPAQGSRLACGLARPKEEHPPRDVCYRSFGRTPNTITGRVNNGTELTAIDSTHQAGKEPGAADQSGRAGGAGGVGASGRRVGEGRPGSERSEVGTRVSAS